MESNVAMEGSLRKIISKEKIVRTTLTTPYLFKWPQLTAESERCLCSEVARALRELKIRKNSHPEVRLETKNGKMWAEKNAAKKKMVKENWEKSKKAREFLVLGMSQVIRSLENDQLCAVLLCRDVQPAKIIEPLLMLCGSRDVHAAAVSGLGDTLKAVLNFKSCIAIGFKRGVSKSKKNPFRTLLKLIGNTAVPLPDELKRMRVVKAVSKRGETPQGESEEETESEEDAGETNLQDRPDNSRQTPTKEIPFASKDYSHLYIEKANLESAPATQRTFGPGGDFISLGNKNSNRNEMAKSRPFLPDKLMELYKTMKAKQCKPKVKAKKEKKKRLAKK